MTTLYGPKGVTWDYNEDGNPMLTDLGEAVMVDSSIEMTDGYSGKFTDGTSKINNDTWSTDATTPEAANGDTYNYQYWETRSDRPVSEIEQDWRDHTGHSDVMSYLTENDHIAIKIGTTYSEAPKSDELMTVWNQVAETINTYSWRAIYADSDDEFDSIVDQMVARANEYGYEECVEFQNAEAERMKARPG